MSDSDPEPDFSWWIEGLGLYDTDREVLLSSKELTDTIVDASQVLLSLQFPSIAGFQSTLLGQNLSFRAVSQDVTSVQIIHTGRYEIVSFT